MENETENIIVYNAQFKPIYGNSVEINIEEILKQNNNTYIIQEINNKKYMLFYSNWNVDNNAIYIINMYDITEIYEERDRQMSEILITDIIILGVSFVAILIFSIYLTNPISKLNKTSKKIAKGKFGERVNIKSNDEIGELAESFNIMAEQIENKVNQLNLNIKQKNDFITGFTHEIKTPMTAIMGYSDMLRLKKCDEEVTKIALNYIYSETKRLSNLSYKLMELMSLTDEKVEMKSIEIKGLIKKIIKIEEISQNIEIETKIENGIIYGNKELLEVVIKNLVENAKKAEPKDNKILITGESLQNGKYKISVIDKGKGIPEEHIERVTEDFYMVDKSRSRSTGGSGIGLSLVKKILKVHNSKIHIESKINVGTKVWFELQQEEKTDEN